METQTIDVTNLEEGNKVELLGGAYEVVSVVKKWANERDLTLDEVGGASRLNLYDLERGLAFERIVPDPEEFRVRSTSLPVTFWIEFEQRINSDEIYMAAYKHGEHTTSMVVDKADLKAVVEKL